MKNRAAACAILVCAALVCVGPVSAGEVLVYITDHVGSSIEAIDPQTNRVVQVIKDVAVPHGIAFSPDGSRIYVSSEGEEALQIFDRKTGAVLNKIHLSGLPNNIAITKDGSRVLVAIRNGQGGIDVVDVVADKFVKTIPTKAPLHNVYVTPDGQFAVAGSIVGESLSVIDLATDQPAWDLPLGAGARPIAIEANADGSTKRLFVQLSKFDGFAVVDFAARKEVQRIKFPGPPSGLTVHEPHASAPSHGIAIAPDGKTLWANSNLSNAVYAYELPDLKLIGHVALPVREVAGKPTPAVPNWLTFTPDSKRLYVSDFGIDSVSVIDTDAVKEIAVIPVGKAPQRSATLVLQ